MLRVEELKYSVGVIPQKSHLRYYVNDKSGNFEKQISDHTKAHPSPKQG
jgi:hypothetical protein